MPTTAPRRQRAGRQGTSAPRRSRGRRPARRSASTAWSTSSWSGEPPRTAVKSLQAHVVRLRTALEPERPVGSPGQFVVRRQAGYALVLEDGRARRPAVHRAERPWPRPAHLRGRRRRRHPGPGARPVARHAVRRLAGRGLRRRRAAPPRGGLEQRQGAVARGSARARPARRGDTRAPAPGRRRPDPRAVVVAAGAGAVPLRPAGRRTRHAPGGADDPGRRARRGARARSSSRRRRGSSARTRASMSRARAQARRRCRGSWGRASSPGVRTRDWPPTSSRTGASSAAVTASSSRSWVRWSTADCSSSPGPAASGKSSLVRAGLLPALAEGALPGSQEWSAVVITPGSRPADALAGMLPRRGRGRTAEAPGVRPAGGDLVSRRRSCRADGIPGRAARAAR